MRSALETYEPNEQYIRLVALLSELMRGQYYGNLDIRFENGKITVCKKTESIRI